ncbi:MAG: glycosyltransferase family 9 protein [Desulfobacteraceae bacterium]|nr:MAG: glycosyltransferase family 9 protein [Desulfobacteraceae bacterium]
MPHVSKISVKSIFKAIYLNARCFALKTLSILLFQRNIFPVIRNIGSILLIRVDRVGDMVLSTHAFRAIKVLLPQVHLIVMASPANAPVLKNNPDVDEVIVYDRSASLLEKIQFINGLRSRHLDLAIDPYTDYELKTAWLAGMSGADHRIGYAAFGREFFFNCMSPKIEGNKHFIDGATDLLKHIGISSENRKPAIYLGADEQAWANQWLQENRVQSKKIVAIHPGAYYETQRWLPEYYAGLINLIRRNTSFEVVVLGGPSDALVVEDILAGIKPHVCVSVQEDIRKFFAILAQCRLLVCNNSGPLHCAVALGIPTISFMGPTIKEQWMPIGESHRVLRLDDLPCIGCNLGRCKIRTHDCMRLIEPKDVVEIIVKECF